MLDAACPQTSDCKFFSFWTLGLTPVICQELSGLQQQTEGCAVGFPTFEVLGLRLASWLFSLQMAYCGTSPCDHLARASWGNGAPGVVVQTSASLQPVCGGARCSRSLRTAGRPAHPWKRELAAWSTPPRRARTAGTPMFLPL
ncbi:RPE-spondin, isoform CRA_a [Homo sapiens]|nr:RPE-spondin, isoform CRA_a [Homo sapiens]